MSLAIYPRNLGELETDFSTLIWLTNRGTRTNVPSTSWLIIGAEKPILVDTSFRIVDDTARRSSEQTLEAQLARHGLHPEDIGYVVHTHLHIDHWSANSSPESVACSPAGIRRRTRWSTWRSHQAPPSSPAMPPTWPPMSSGRFPLATSSIWSK